MEEEPRVSYPISEVLKQISDKIDKLFDALSSKADKAELDALASKVNGHDDQIRTLLAANVSAAKERREQTEWRKWIVPVVISVLGVIATVLQVVH